MGLNWGAVRFDPVEGPIGDVLARMRLRHAIVTGERYDPDEARDPDGKWSGGGGGGGTDTKERPAKAAKAPAPEDPPRTQPEAAISPAEAEREAKAGIQIGAALAKAGNAAPALKGSEGHPALISERIPTGKKAKENGEVDFLSIGLDELRQDPKTFDHDMALLKNGDFYPNLRPEDTSGDSEHIARAAIDQIKSNLEWLYNTTPPAIRERSKLWYVGARRLVDEKVRKYKISDASVAGVYAALSPQKDWFMNVSLGDRVIETYMEQQGHAWDPKMEDTTKAIWKPKDAKLIDSIRGHSLGQLKTPMEKAAWIRTYDEAHNDRSFHVITPEGERGAVQQNAADRKGNRSNAKVAWQSTPCVAKAVVALEARGNRETISVAMGEMHKVRNFYDNILDPFSPNGDVTMDTHAVGAAWIEQYAGGDLPVLHNLNTSLNKVDQPAGYEMSSGSTVTGVKGTYGLYAEAYREAAKDLKIEPRELQSITWEAQRGLYGGGEKIGEAVRAIWQDYRAGKFTLDQTHERIGAVVERDHPDWY